MSSPRPAIAFYGLWDDTENLVKFLEIIENDVVNRLSVSFIIFKRWAARLHRQLLPLRAPSQILRQPGAVPVIAAFNQNEDREEAMSPAVCAISVEFAVAAGLPSLERRLTGQPVATGVNYAEIGRSIGRALRTNRPKSTDWPQDFNRSGHWMDIQNLMNLKGIIPLDQLLNKLKTIRPEFTWHLQSFAASQNKSLGLTSLLSSADAIPNNQKCSSRILSSLSSFYFNCYLWHNLTPHHYLQLPPGGAPPFPTIIAGSDDPADYATTGYVLNHFSLNVNNATASIDFYTKVFGMRLIFTFRATEKVSISYLAHSHGGKNGTAYQTTSELNRNKNNMEGLLELLHYDYDSYKHPPTISLDNTFSHFGIVVPCVTRFQKRVDKLKLPILKRAGGEMTQEALEAVAKSHGLRKMWEENKLEAESLLLMLLESIPGFSDFIFMTDPDGNLIEVQPQELPQIPL